MIVQRQRLPSYVTEQIITHARTLFTRGAQVIVGSCGFMAAVHSEIAPKVHRPLFSSSLLALVYLASEKIPLPQIGILTFDADALTPLHFEGIGATMPTAIVGLPSTSTLRRVISNNETRLDLALVEAEVSTAARQLCERWPEVRTIILECTNLGVYKHAIAQTTGCRVIDIVDVVNRSMLK